MELSVRCRYPATLCYPTSACAGHAWGQMVTYVKVQFSMVTSFTAEKRSGSLQSLKWRFVILTLSDVLKYHVWMKSVSVVSPPSYMSALWSHATLTPVSRPRRETLMSPKLVVEERE